MRPALTFSKSLPSKLGSKVTKLHSVDCAMAPASLRKSPFVQKAEQLDAVAPDIAAIVEELLDDLLLEIQQCDD